MKRARAFSLIELLVALAVFAALAAAAYGGLAAIARTRGALAAQQDRFAAVMRAVSALERDLRQAIARPVLGNNGQTVPALAATCGAAVMRCSTARPIRRRRRAICSIMRANCICATTAAIRRGTRRGRHADCRAQRR